MPRLRHLIPPLLLSLTLSISALPASSAEITPSPTATLSPFAQYELDMAKYKIELKIYQKARAEQVRQLRFIAITFNQALRQAYIELRSTGRSASSRASFAAARALAAANRDKAVAELEPLMDPPQPPDKPSGYGMKGNGMKGNGMKGNKSKGLSPKAEKKS
jgi:hypothetical protein